MLNVWFSTGKQRNLRATSSISLLVLKHSGYRIVLLAICVALCWNSKLHAVFWMDLYVISCLSVYRAGFSKTSRPPSKTISVRLFFFSAKNCKLAKVARQGATIDFYNLFPFFLSPGSFYFPFPIPLLVCLVWFSRLSGRKKLRFGIFSLKYLAAYVAKLAQYKAQWFQLAAKCKDEIHTWALPSIQFIFLDLNESQEEKPKESFHLTVEMTEVRLSGVDSLFASKW